MIKKIVIAVTVIAALALLAAGTFRIMNLRTYQVFGELTSQVHTDKKAVALTFDDGPTEQVNQLLPLLDKYGVKATFFLVGNELEESLGLGQKIAQAGHQIGNHTYSHNRMVFKSPSYMKDEIERTNRLIRQIGYSGNIDFRPPYGKKLVGLPYYLMKNDIHTVMWSVEPDTYYSAVEDKISHVMREVIPGSIILMHPMYDTTGNELKAVEGIIRGLEESGYSFMTVSELRGLETAKGKK